MDLTILWVILGAIGGIGVIIGIYYGLKALGVSFSDIFKGIDISVFIINLAQATLNEMLKDNPALVDKIDIILDTVEETLNFIRAQLAEDPTIDKEILISQANAFADEILSDYSIELNANEKEILYIVIKTVYNAWASLPVEKK